MKGIQLSTYQPRGPKHPDAVPLLRHYDHVIPVAGSAAALSEQAQIIHSWLVEQHAATGSSIRVGDVVRKHGKPHRLLEWKTLNAHPLEELVAANLLTVEENPA